MENLNGIRLRRASSLQAEQERGYVLRETALRAEVIKQLEEEQAQRRAPFSLMRERTLDVFGVKPKTLTFSERIEKIMTKLGYIKHMDGAFYNDMRTPFIAADIAAVTLATTDKALYPASNFPVLGGQYFSMIGKKLRIRLFGRITSALTPGNGTFDVYYGTGADANGVILVSSAAVALTASQTNVTWELQVQVHCRSIGNAGTLFGDGHVLFNEAISASRWMIPATAPVVSAACDLTAALIISVQFKRSGSTVETMQVHDMEVIALN